MSELALHHFTIVDADVPALIRIANELDCRQVCVFVDADTPSGPVTFPSVTPANVDTVCRLLAEHQVAVTNIEYFPLTESIDWALAQLKLELGAQLKARLAVTHIHDPDTGRARDSLARLCDMAAALGLQVGLEFMGLSPANPSLETAREHVMAVNTDNLGVAIDALHLFRTGGSIAQVRALPPSKIAYVQLCDGWLTPNPQPDLEQYRLEAFERMRPGDGELPLTELIAACPDDTWYDVEVPTPSLAETTPAIDRARAALAQARQLLENGPATT